MTGQKLKDYLPGKITPKIINEQTRFSYAVFPVTTTMLVVAISFIAFLVWKDVGKDQATYWFVAALCIVMVRIAIYWAYNSDKADRNSTIWRYAFHFGAYASASLILIASICFFSRLASAEQLIFTILALGIASGALPVLATDPKSYTIYVLLITVPITFFYLAAPEISTKLVGTVTILFIGMLIMAAHLFKRSILDSMIYRYRSEQLAQRLKVANSRLSAANRELQQISTIDELTGTYNKRFFNQRFNEIWADHVRQNQTLTALMVDVDHFKAFNDLYGHLQGDLCLKRIANELSGVIHRPRDFVSRFGGEEFLLILPATELEGAKEIAEQIHSRIKQLNIPHQVEGLVNRVTVSIGYSSITPGKKSDPERFLHEVDRALYQAKHQGRNTSVFL